MDIHLNARELINAVPPSERLNVRVDFHAVTGIAASLIKGRQENAVKAMERPDAHPQLIDGETRTRAILRLHEIYRTLGDAAPVDYLRALGVADVHDAPAQWYPETWRQVQACEVRATLIPYQNALDAFKAMYQGNQNRADFTLSEESAACHRAKDLLAANGQSATPYDIALYLNMRNKRKEPDAERVSYLLAVKGLIPELVEPLNKGQLNLRIAASVARLQAYSQRTFFGKFSIGKKDPSKERLPSAAMVEALVNQMLAEENKPLPMFDMDAYLVEAQKMVTAKAADDGGMTREEMAAHITYLEAMLERERDSVRVLRERLQEYAAVDRIRKELSMKAEEKR